MKKLIFCSTALLMGVMLVACGSGGGKKNATTVADGEQTTVAVREPDDFARTLIVEDAKAVSFHEGTVAYNSNLSREELIAFYQTVLTKLDATETATTDVEGIWTYSGTYEGKPITIRLTPMGSSQNVMVTY